MKFPGTGYSLQEPEPRYQSPNINLQYQNPIQPPQVQTSNPVMRVPPPQNNAQYQGIIHQPPPQNNAQYQGIIQPPTFNAAQIPFKLPNSETQVIVPAPRFDAVSGPIQPPNNNLPIPFKLPNIETSALAAAYMASWNNPGDYAQYGPKYQGIDLPKSTSEPKLAPARFTPVTDIIGFNQPAVTIPAPTTIASKPLIQGSTSLIPNFTSGFVPMEQVPNAMNVDSSRYSAMPSDTEVAARLSAHLTSSKTDSLNKKYQNQSSTPNPSQSSITALPPLHANHEIPPSLTSIDNAFDSRLAAYLPDHIKDITAGIDLSDLSPGQVSAIKAVLNRRNILLTGPAGTGKSHTVKRIKDIYEKLGRKIGITSTTGASAILIEGKTIHSWSGIGICGSKESALKRVMEMKAPQERINTTHLLIIDEVSMLPATILDALDYVFRMVRQCNLPFGGMQVILCGDFYQLKPVKSNHYAFDSVHWDQMIHEVHELTQIFRQENAEFCRALNEIRVGEVSQATVDLFTKCMGRQFQGDIKPTELYPTNDDVSELNEAELWKLASEQNMIREIAARHDIVPVPRTPHTEKFKRECIERLNKECTAPELLQLCVGAQVMLIKNLNVDAGLANGSRAVVVGFGPRNEPLLKFLNGHIMYMTEVVWSLRINEHVRIKRSQYPIKLAWSITIHKAQGASIDLVRMSLGENVFGDSMIYTALSRAKTLEGLSITTINWNKISVDKRVKDFYAKYKNKTISN